MGKKALLIGFGEVGQALAGGWRDAGIDVAVSAYDLKQDDPAALARLEADADATGVTLLPHRPQAFRGVRHVFSLVTADQALSAARRAASAMPAGAVFWDMNSVAPQTKRSAASAVQRAGLRYLDVGILSPIHPKRHRSPLAIAGSVDDEIEDAIASFGFQAEVISHRIGDAAALKLLRSIVIKGLESLLVECYIAGQKTGLTEKALRSLAPSFPGIDWADRMAYVLERVRSHGPRRATEMEEAARFLDGIGVAPLMSQAAAKRLIQGTDGSDDGHFD